MARIKYSGLIHEISGSLGGSTLQRNAFGHTIRNKPITRRQRSICQLTSQQFISQVSKAWSDLSFENRTKWDRAVGFYQIYAKYNSSSLLTGRALFFKYNLTALTAGESMISVPSYLSPSWYNYTILLQNPGGAWLFLVPDVLFQSNEQWILASFSQPLIEKSTVIRNNAHVCKVVYESDIYYRIDADYTKVYGSKPAVGAYVDMWFSVFHTNLPVVFFEQYLRLQVTTP